jgi:hypothetical protein
MSESRPRYQRSTGGLLGALIVTVIAVVAFAVIRAVTDDTEPTPVRTVDYAASVKAGRADGLLSVMAPEQLPKGWRATSASYVGGGDPTWHLGLLTDKGKYVGVEESRRSIEHLVREHVDVAAERGEDVTINGEPWQVWTDAGGDYAVARSLEVGGSAVESWVVVGSAPDAAVRELAGTLEGGQVRLTG